MGYVVVDLSLGTMVFAGYRIDIHSSRSIAHHRVFGKWLSFPLMFFLFADRITGLLCLFGILLGSRVQFPP